ncbi:MAG: hypothetical protein ACLTKI_02895 [Lachnospiraceae bacterium]
MEQYEKNQDVFEIIKPKQDHAIMCMKKRIEKLNVQHIEIFSRQSNPVTTVGELVEYLNERG